jgi:membrane-bound lytic murein transglycosylase B
VSPWAKQEGPKFIERNKAIFTSAEAQFLTVPKEIPTGILDAETQYGVAAYKADYPVVQTLLTIAVFQPDFQAKGWPENQLISFLRICKKNDWKPFEKLGSRTGAIGKPQFEPTSYEKLAMHWSGSSCVLWNESPVPADLDDMRDTICSIFNYLHATGFGGNENRWRFILHEYNKDWRYCDAILDIADFLAGRPDHHHYKPIKSIRAAIN